LSVAAELPPHMRESFTTLGFHAPTPPAVTRKDGWH
jgi:hypothetical protein